VIYTEAEAEAKWCPQARVANGEAGNRYSMDIDAAKASAFAKCIGSNCMMWRSYDGTRGYCGLGGRP
jgi:hypothetical protein